ncbi:MAG: T9SS type A sorting domain-containing protein [Bacteroidia bacterium]
MKTSAYKTENLRGMKRLFILIICIAVSYFANAQQLIRYGFSAPVYDNFNNNDASAAIELIVLIPNNDTLKTSVGSAITPIDGSAKNGVHYNFSAQNHLFLPGTTNWNNSNRKSFNINIVPDPVYWGKRSFILKLSNFIGIVPQDQLINGQDELIVIIDYDGSSLGLPKLSIADYTIYPNPAKDLIKIAGVKAERYFITDLAGRLVLDGDVIDNTIDVSKLANGFYVINAKADRGLIVHKFIKE